MSSIPAPLPLCSRLTISPQDTATYEYRVAVLYDIAAKVAQVAVVILCALVLAISLGLGPVATLPIGLAIAVIAAPIGLIPLSSYCQNKATASYKISEREEGVAKKLEEIKEWRTPQIEAFLQEQEIALEHLPMTSLAAKSPQEPLRALLPLIARFLYEAEIHEKASKAEQENFAFSSDDAELQFATWNLAHQIATTQTLPAAFEMVALLEQIKRPTEEISLDAIGSFSPTPFHHFLLRIYEATEAENEWYKADQGSEEEKAAEQKVNRATGRLAWFRFNDPSRPPLTLQVEMSPERIRELLFPPAQPALPQ